MSVTFRKFQPHLGPKRWVFKDPDTGYKFEEPSLKELVQRIVSYRSQNRLPELEGLNHVIENYLCSLPENMGACVPTELKRGFMSFLSGGMNLLTNLWYGENNLVDESEAERRGKICSACPMNQFPNKGPFIVWSDQIAEASTGGKMSKYHEHLGNCGCCSCTLRAKVWFKGPFELDQEEVSCIKNNMPKCWQLENLKPQK